MIIKTFVRRNRSCVLALIPAVLILLSCYSGHGDNPLPTTPEKDYDISIVSGNNQTGPVGSALPAPLVVYVKEKGGTTAPNLRVDFSIIEGWGELSQSSNVTNAEGQTSVVLTPEDPPGAVKVEAKVYGKDESVVFTATGTQVQ